MKEEEETKTDEKKIEENMKAAALLKEEGNYWFKEKEYQKAISKYCKVKLYVDAVAPKNYEGEDSGMVDMVQGAQNQI